MQKACASREALHARQQPYRPEQANMSAQLDALNKSAPLEQQLTAARIRGEKDQLQQLYKQRPTLQERESVAQKLYNDGIPYAESGDVSWDYEHQRQYDYLAQAQAVAQLDANIAQLEASISSDEALLAKLPSDEEQQRAALVASISSLDEKRTQVTGDGFYIMRSPINGQVSALQAYVGQPTQLLSATGVFVPLMTIVPPDALLQAEVYVPSRAIGFITKGQKVRLLYDAFPYEIFGAAYGIVDEVSTTVYRPEEVAAAVKATEPVYKVIVHPLQANINAYGTQTPLRPGMAFTADFILEERSFLQFLLDPVIAAQGRILGDK